MIFKNYQKGGKMKEIIIVGAGDLGREVLNAAEEARRANFTNLKVTGFYDESPQKIGSTLAGLPVWGPGHLNGLKLDHIGFIIGIGNPHHLKNLYQKLSDHGVNNWVSVIHPRAYLAPDLTIGQGVYIAAHASISVNIHIGNFCIVNQNCSLGHDIILADYTVISPGCMISGRCETAEGVFFGSGAITFPGVKIGASSMIGAGCVVKRNIPGNIKLLSMVKNMEVPL